MRERRRGQTLEQAILEAAWLELSEHGYGGLTMERVAERSGTSRPVLARRWGTRAELAVAAIRLQMTKHPMDVADRGDLRGELLDLLERASRRASGIAAAFTLFSNEYFSESLSAPRDLQTALAQGEVRHLAAILQRAVERGEIRADSLAPPIASLLGDLFRYHVIMNFAAPPEALRQAWVDEIFLPLARKK